MPLKAVAAHKLLVLVTHESCFFVCYVSLSTIVHISSDCLPAIRPTSTRGMVPDFSHNEDNCIQFTKLLFQLRFYLLCMAFFFLSFTVFLVPLLHHANKIDPLLSF